MSVIPTDGYYLYLYLVFESLVLDKCHLLSPGGLLKLETYAIKTTVPHKPL